MDYLAAGVSLFFSWLEKGGTVPSANPLKNVGKVEARGNQRRNAARIYIGRVGTGDLRSLAYIASALLQPPITRGCAGRVEAG